MQFKFIGSIPSKKNSMIPLKTGRMINCSKYKAFKDSIREQCNKFYFDKFVELIDVLPKPLIFVMDIVRYENRDFDWSNKIASVEDALFCFKKKKGIFECLPLDDSYKSLKIIPGSVRIDKQELSSKSDDYFTLTPVRAFNYEVFDF